MGVQEGQLRHSERLAHMDSNFGINGAKEDAMIDSASLQWRKSTYCGSTSCIEIAFTDGYVAVRDSKDRQGSVLLFTRAEWDSFTRGVQEGQFRPA
jgi:hypothetical protein